MARLDGRLRSRGDARALLRHGLAALALALELVGCAASVAPVESADAPDAGFDHGCHTTGPNSCASDSPDVPCGMLTGAWVDHARDCLVPVRLCAQGVPAQVQPSEHCYYGADADGGVRYFIASDSSSWPPWWLDEQGLVPCPDPGIPRAASANDFCL